MCFPLARPGWVLEEASWPSFFKVCLHKSQGKNGVFKIWRGSALFASTWDYEASEGFYLGWAKKKAGGLQDIRSFVHFLDNYIPIL